MSAGFVVGYQKGRFRFLRYTARSKQVFQKIIILSFQESVVAIRVVRTIIPFMSESIFSKIIRREIPSQFVYEDDVCVVIMDKFPSVKGQTLVIPKRETDYIFDLDDATYTHIFTIAKKVAKASDKALNPTRTCLAVEGFEVPHVHIKIYPIHDTSRGLGPYLSNGEMAEDEDLAALAEKIKLVL